MIKNKLLIRQLKKSNIKGFDSLSNENFRDFLSLVENAYQDMENNIYRLERTLELSSNELRYLNLNLENRIKKEVEENRQKDEKIFNQSRSASMGEMISNIAHQWRQPLSAMSTTASSMQLQIELHIATEEEILKSYDQILEYITFLSDTIDDFRGFLNTNEKTQTFDLRESIKKSQNKIKIIYTEPSEALRTLGSPNALVQVILNILNNANDALVSNEVKERKVFIELRSDQKSHTILIKDTALGIPKKIISKIFDPYFTTKHKSQGTGIGLHMSKNIIEQKFKGTISVYNTKFKHEGSSYEGACFKIVLLRV